MAKLINDVVTHEKGDLIQLGKVLGMKSKILKQELLLHVCVPQVHAIAEGKLPVFYMLDGGGHACHMAGMLQFYSGQFPDMIYVGIDLPNRPLYSTPSALNDSQYKVPGLECGKADVFQEVFAKEIIPFIEKKYKAAPFRLLGGNSLTGLFAAWTLFERAELFDAYMASSPSMWWNDGEILKTADEKIRKVKGKKYIHVALENNTGRHGKCIKSLVSKLKKNAGKKLLWKFNHFKTETHGTVNHPAIYEFMRHVFPTYNVMEHRKRCTAKVMINYYKKLSKQYGYDVVPPLKGMLGVGNHYKSIERFKEARDMFECCLEFFPRSKRVHNAIKSLG